MQHVRVILIISERKGQAMPVDRTRCRECEEPFSVGDETVYSATSGGPLCKDCWMRNYSIETYEEETSEEDA